MTELGALLLPVVPLLALLLALLFGRYPGCRAIVRFSGWIAAATRPRLGVAGHRPPAQRPHSFARGGGFLLALSLSGRAPPATA